MRRLVSDGTPQFRAVIRIYVRTQNPEYVQGNGKPYFILTDKIVKREYGPYGQIGTAKAILTRETMDLDNNRLKWGVVDGWIEEATTVWNKVDLG